MEVLCNTGGKEASVKWQASYQKSAEDLKLFHGE